MLSEAIATVVAVRGRTARLRVEPDGLPNFELPLGLFADEATRVGDRLRVAYEPADPAALTVLAAAA